MRRVLNVLSPVFALAVLCVLGVLIASCGNGSQVQVRFVHAIWDAGELDIDFNGTKYFSQMSFPSFQPSTGYAGVPAGSDTIEGLATGQTTEAFSNSNVNLTAGTVYTLVATGNIASGPNNVVIMTPTDDNTAPTNGTVNFRIIDASPDAPSTIYVYIYAAPLLSNACQGAPTATLTYPGTSGYVNMNYNSDGQGYLVYVCNAENGNPLTGDSSGYPFNVGSLTEGSIRTLIFTDNANGTYISLPQPLLLSDLN